MTLSRASLWGGVGINTTGRYTRSQLIELAEQADAGFDRRIMAELFAMLERYPDCRQLCWGS